MKEYEETRNSLIEMLEDLDDKLAKITHDTKEPLDQILEGQTENQLPRPLARDSSRKT